MAPYDPLSIPQGATFVVSWELLDGDTGAPITDSTGFVGAMQIRPTAGDPTLLYAFAAPVFDGATVTFTAPAADTATMDFGRAVYDVLITDAAGLRSRIAEGPVSLDIAVTV